jgi:hypothetical protein
MTTRPGNLGLGPARELAVPSPIRQAESLAGSDSDSKFAQSPSGHGSGGLEYSSHLSHRLPLRLLRRGTATAASVALAALAGSPVACQAAGCQRVVVTVRPSRPPARPGGAGDSDGESAQEATAWAQAQARLRP